MLGVHRLADLVDRPVAPPPLSRIGVAVVSSSPSTANNRRDGVAACASPAAMAERDGDTGPSLLETGLDRLLKAFRGDAAPFARVPPVEP